MERGGTILSEEGLVDIDSSSATDKANDETIFRSFESNLVAGT